MTMARTAGASESERLARRFLETVVAGEWDPSLFSPDATSWHNHDEVMAPLVDGAAGLAALRSMVPDLAPEGLRVEGQERGFVAEFVWTGTLGDGTQLRAPVCIIGAVVDGRITALREYLDSSHFAPLVAASAPQRPR